MFVALNSDNAGDLGSMMISARFAVPASAALLLLPIMAGRAVALPVQPALESVDQAVCRLIETAARSNHLPIGFMTRVIWRESSFRPRAVSPAGAEGIAQFMRGTAQERGLADPFDPEQAIPKAAGLLAELRRRFGTLGAAAAAYHAGPARVASWLRGDGQLPAQTRLYVRLVTTHTVEEWAGPGSAEGEAGESCLALAAELRRERGGEHDDEGFAPFAPWGVQLAGNFSKALALASFARARQRYAAAIGREAQPMIIGRLLRSRGTRRFYQVRLPAPSRQVAETLCSRIQAIGGSCFAMRS
jgi:hypothetical protein